jgi:hypothetical protein
MQIVVMRNTAAHYISANVVNLCVTTAAIYTLTLAAGLNMYGLPHAKTL